MADWMSMRTPQHDFLSMYTTQTETPSHRSNSTASELQFSPSPIKFNGTRLTNGNDDPDFCQRDNIDECVAYINQEVTSVGMPSLYDGQTGTFDIVRLVNCTHDLLQKQRNSARLREDLESRLHRNESDLDQLRVTHMRLKSTLEQCQRNLAISQEKERQFAAKLKSTGVKLKAEKEEVKRLGSVIQHREAQYRHELKKNQREVVKLKERLQKLLSDRNQGRKVGMELSMTLQRSDGKRGTWQTGSKHEEEMYRLVISDYEMRQKELMVENGELRQCLKNMQKELVSLFNEPSTGTLAPGKLHHSQTHLDELSNHSNDSDDVISVISNHSNQADEVSEGHYQMPYDIVRESIEKSLKEKCRLLKMYIRKMEKQRGVKHIKENIPSNVSSCNISNRGSAEESLKKEIEKLTKQSERYQQVIKQQELFIQENLNSQAEVEADASILRDSYLWDEWEALQLDKQLLKQHKTHIEEERKNIKDAKQKLEMERRVLSSEKAHLLQKHFLQLSPFSQHSTSVTPNSSSLLVQRSRPRSASTTLISSCSTPVHSSNGSHMQHLPSTPDLYRTLGLETNRQRFLPATPSFSPAPVPHHTSTSTPSSITQSSAFDCQPSTVELYRSLGIFHHNSRPTTPVERTSMEDVSPAHSQTPPSVSSQDSNSPVSTSRINEHMENIRLTLFNQQNPMFDDGSGDEDEEQDDDTRSKSDH